MHYDPNQYYQDMAMYQQYYMYASGATTAEAGMNGYDPSGAVDEPAEAPPLLEKPASFGELSIADNLVVNVQVSKRMASWLLKKK